jgi:hypothetical protein
MYVQRNAEAPSRDLRCSGKAKILYIRSVWYVALVIQHATRMRQVAIRGLSGSTLRFHIIFKKARFSKKSY